MRKLSFETVRRWFLISASFLFFGIFSILASEVYEGSWTAIDNQILFEVAKYRDPSLNNGFVEVTAMGAYPVCTIILLGIVMIMAFNRNYLGLIHASIAF